MPKHAMPIDHLTLGFMLRQMEGGTYTVLVMCTACKTTTVLDHAAIAALVVRVGPQYSLVNRRCRCRLTPDRRGWNRFWYRAGYCRPLWNDAGLARWLALRDGI